MKVPAYCALCRQFEVKKYGTVLNTAGPRHKNACKKAKCKHPAWLELGMEFCKLYYNSGENLCPQI